MLLIWQQKRNEDCTTFPQAREINTEPEIIIYRRSHNLLSANRKHTFTRRLWWGVFLGLDKTFSRPRKILV